MISTTTDELTPADLSDVLVLHSSITENDGLPPLSERVIEHLGCKEHGVKHVLVRDDGHLIGYAHLGIGDSLASEPTAEFMVESTARRRGVGSLLLDNLVGAAPGGQLQLWAHGEQAPSRALATSRGFDAARTLLQMRRSLYSPLPAADPPAGVGLRMFRPGQDDAEWVALNARTFIHLPDQGSLTIADLHERMQEEWFDPESFLVAFDGDSGRMIGYHWVKIHKHVGSSSHDPIGETYVIGIDPDLQSKGLGRALMVMGLRLMRSKGLSQAMLYVESTNERAKSMYEGLGFLPWDTHVLYRRSGVSPAEGS